MFTRIRLADFKSFVDEQVDLAPLVFLVGANASGKSNFLDAFRFLQGLTFDMTVSELLNGEHRVGPDPWPGIRGGAQEASRIGVTTFGIEVAWRPHQWHPRHSHQIVEYLLHRLNCRTSPSPKLCSERIDTAGVRDGTSATEVTFGDETAPFPPAILPGSHTTDATILALRGNKHLDDASMDWADELYAAYRGMHFLAISPEHMRSYGRKDSPLGPDGANLSGVLARLCDDATERQTIVDWLAELCATELRDIDFVTVPELGDVMAILVEKDGKRVSARSLSDGTLRFLGLAIALRTAAPGSVFLIEEIDNGLHPSRIHLLVDYLQSIARERQVQILATTHSPVVLHALELDTLMDAVVFGRIPDREGTVMRRLRDLPHLDDALNVEEIDRLFETGWLERAL
jgi:predicted ATPase